MKTCNKRKETEQVLNIHELLPDSSVNGPGKRYVIWTQGCLRKCPECCNPDTHDIGDRRLISIADLLNDIQAHSGNIEGISISGGEPFLQAEPLSSFLKNLREDFPELSVILFSGYTLAEIESIPHGRKCLRYIDVLIDGEYCASQAAAGIPASENQKLHFFQQNTRPAISIPFRKRKYLSRLLENFMSLEGQYRSQCSRRTHNGISFIQAHWDCSRSNI